jgi:hypothetical protein
MIIAQEPAQSLAALDAPLSIKVTVAPCQRQRPAIASRARLPELIAPPPSVPQRRSGSGSRVTRFIPNGRIPGIPLTDKP